MELIDPDYWPELKATQYIGRIVPLPMMMIEGNMRELYRLARWLCYKRYKLQLSTTLLVYSIEFKTHCIMTARHYWLVHRSNDAWVESVASYSVPTIRILGQSY